jgi:hypothetical protein
MRGGGAPLGPAGRDTAVVRRHLTRSEAVAAVERGAAVGQFLGFAEPVDDRRTFRYAEVSGGRQVRVYAFHKLDTGDGRFADLLEFLDVGEWDPFDEQGNYLGEDPSIVSFDDAEAALDWVESHGGADGRWVNASMLGDEYLEARQALTRSDQ